MSASKMTAYTISSLLYCASVGAVALSFALDSEGYIMASQTMMLCAIVISSWAFGALLAGKKDS